jgi:hypothetical protein
LSFVNNWRKVDGCSLLRAEGFPCILDVLYGGLRISKLVFLLKKEKCFSAVFVKKKFIPQNPGAGSGTGSATLEAGLTSFLF